MVRTQIQFEKTQYETIRKPAQRKKISISEAVRRLVTRGLQNGLEEDRPPRAARLLRIAGIGRSGVKDLGRSHDRYLLEDQGK